MKISEVIKRLQEIQELDGDLPCFIQQINAIDVGDMTEVKGIDCCDSIETREPFMVRIIDFVD